MGGKIYGRRPERRLERKNARRFDLSVTDLPPRLGELFTNLYVIGCQSAKVRRLEAKVKHLGNSIFS